MGIIETMNNAETTYSLDGIDYKAVANTDGMIEVYDLSVWASEGIERFVGNVSSSILPLGARIALAKSCLLANGFEIEWSCGKIAQIADESEGKTRFIFSTDTIVSNGEMRGERCLNDIIGMIYL